MQDDTRLCSIEGCGRKLRARGWCNTHYLRWRRKGDVRADAPVMPMGQVGCSVEGCERAHGARGWCDRHWQRWSRTGDPLGDRTQVRGICAVSDCGLPHASRGYCSTHYARLRIHGDASIVLPWNGGRPRVRPFGPPNRLGAQNWRGDAVGYSGMHQRLRKALGKASSHKCRCGAPATGWAYDHGDPFDERWSVDPGSRTHRTRYSLRFEHYMPLCKSCHQRLDIASVANQKVR